jgi:MFS family permease
VQSREGQATPLLADAPPRSPAIARPVTARPGLWAPLAVAAVTLVGAALRVAVAHQSLFADELSTYWIVSTRGLGGVLSTVHSNAEITPPLSFVLGWLATRIDLTPEMLRLPSLVAGIATIPIVYQLGLRTVGRAAGAVAASLTALAPFMIYYSGEARGYALVMAFVALSTLTMLIAVDIGRARWWVAYAAFSGAAIYTHYTCVFVLGVGLTWLLWAHPEARRPALLAGLAVLVAYIPWLSGLRNDLKSPTTDILSALQPFDALHVRLSIEHWSVGYPYASIAPLRDLPGRPALVLLGLALAVAAAGLVVRFGRDRRSRRAFHDRRLLLIVALALATPVGEALFSAFGSTTLFSTRNLASSWPAFALSLAALLLSAGPRLGLLAVALAIASFAIGAAKMLQDRFQRPDYAAAGAYIDRSAAPGDAVIDESGVLSPGPLTHLDPVLHRPLRVFRANAPRERQHPFTVFDPVVSPAAASRRAVATGGRHVFLVSDVAGARALRRLPGYRAVAILTYPGVLRVVVRTYTRGSGRPMRRGRATGTG